MMKFRRFPVFLLLVAALAFVAPELRADAADNSDGQPAYIPTIIEYDSDAELSDLETEGVVIWRKRSGMALVCIPRELAEHWGERKAPLRAPGQKSRPAPGLRPRKAQPAMDFARKCFDADKIPAGTGLPQPYTGRGVVVGFCDVGFDPLHVNFMDPQGNCRVKRLVHYDELNATRTELSTRAEFEEWRTDDPDNYHATHVGGILAGSYTANGYNGIATDAEIVATTSSLYDVGLLAGAEDIIEYARAQGKPAVINMSVGSHTGPHDGTTLFNRYLSLLGEEAIITISAANAGGRLCHRSVQHTDEAPAWRTLIHSNDWMQYDVTGLIEAWSRDDSPVSVSLLVYDNGPGQEILHYPLAGPEPGEDYFNWKISDETDADFARYFTGSVEVEGMIDSQNGRWVTRIQYDVHTTERSPHAIDNNWARYEFGLEFVGVPGRETEIHVDAASSRFAQWPGFPAPDTDMSVSDLACGENIICVGMYNSRSEIPLLSGSATPLSGIGEVNGTSSYGTLADGRVLPHTVAPGGCTISSHSTPMVEAHPEQIAEASAVAEIEGRKYYWRNLGGTSMSTPYVAGFIATWLEVNPKLTVEQVFSTILATNRTDYPDPSNPRHGHGWFDPYAGIKEIIVNSGITQGVADPDALRIVRRGNILEVLNPTGEAVALEIYAADGKKTLSQPASRQSVITVDISGLPRGVYIATVPGSSASTLKLTR